MSESRLQRFNRDGGLGGFPRVLSYSFTYDSPNLLTGHEFYTPIVGDILLDAWFEVDIAWDATAFCDFGTYYGGTHPTSGIFGRIEQPIDLTISDSESGITGLLTAWEAGDGGSTDLIASSSNSGLYQFLRSAPAKFTTTNPFKIVANTTGFISGDDPGSTMGAAVLYLIVATPEKL